jgi:hypothetical protein
MSLPTNFFIGRGGGAAPVLFDAYGVSAGAITSISSVAYRTGIYSSPNLYDPSRSTSSLMLSNNGSTTNDPKNARLITSVPYQSSFYTLKPMAIYPSGSAGGWDGVTSASDISSDKTLFNEAENDGNNTEYGGQFGGAHYTDTTSAQVICRAFQYAQQTGSDYDVYTKYVFKDTSTGNYTNAMYQTPISAGQGIASTRFNTDLHSAENTLVQVGKDQAGGTRSTSGQSTYLHMRQITNAGSIGNYFETTFSAKYTDQNTHGHSNRGVFLGAQVQGNTMYSWYFTQYNHHSGSGEDGYRFVRLRQPTSNNSPMAVDLAGHMPKAVVASGGVLYPASQVYPHAFFTDYDGNSYGGAAGNTGNVYYVDLSETWNGSGAGLTLHSLGGSRKKYFARVGGTTSAPVFAMISNQNVKIMPFDPVTKTWGSTISEVPLASGDVNGLWPIPETNRIVVSYNNGCEVLEAA